MLLCVNWSYIIHTEKSNIKLMGKHAFKGQREWVGRLTLAVLQNQPYKSCTLVQSDVHSWVILFSESAIREQITALALFFSAVSCKSVLVNLLINNEQIRWRWWMTMMILAEGGHDEDVAVEEYSRDEEEKAKHLRRWSQRCFALCCISLVLLWLHFWSYIEDFARFCGVGTSVHSVIWYLLCEQIFWKLA